MAYLLQDDFTIERPPGTVHGSAVDGTGTTRAATDTESKLSITGGKLTFVGGKATPGWGDPAFAENSSISRTLGRCAVWRISVTDANKNFALGLRAATGEYWGFKFAAANALYVLDGVTPTAGGKQVYAYDYTTEYMVCVALRSSGAWYFIKGGSDAAWRLLYVGRVGTTATLYASIESYNAPIAADFVHVDAATYAPACLASDSFNRTNGAIGTADGAADADVSAATQAWTAAVGTWTITSNKATPATVSGGAAIATLDVGVQDYWLRSEIETTGSLVGFALRYVDASNYALLWVSNTQIALRAVIGGVNQTYAIFPVTIPYSAGGELAVGVKGNQFTVLYSGALIATGTIADSVLQTSTKIGIYSSGAGSVLRHDNFVCWPLTHSGLDALAPDDLSSSYFVAVYRVDANNLEMTVPITGAATTVRAKYQFRKITKVLAGWAWASNAWYLGGIKVVNGGGAGLDINLTDLGPDFTTINSAFEWAYKIGIAGDPTGNFDFYGSLHQAFKSKAFAMAIDGIDITQMGVGGRAYGSQLVLTQAGDIYLPADKTTVVGAVTFTHTLDSGGLRVHHSHTYNAGYEVFQAYSAMLPSDIGGSNQYQVGSNAITLRLENDSANFLNTQAIFGRALDNRHSYQILLWLPTGGPNDSGDWSKSGNFKLWYQDRAPVAGYSTGKFYANWVSSDYADRKPAVASAHTTLYQVVLAPTYTKVVSGAVSPSGTILRRAQRLLAGSVAPAGALLRKPLKSFAGLLDLAGAMVGQAYVKIFRTLAFTTLDRTKIAPTESEIVTQLERNFYMYAGDALHIDARALKADGLGQDLLGASVIWTVSDKDENVVLTKNLSSGISVTDRVTGLLRITVLASETSEWYATRYTHRAVLTDYVGNAVTLMTGSIFVLSR